MSPCSWCSPHLAIWVGANGVERALLIGSLVLVIMAELINSAIERKKAKDVGSAIVLVALAHAGVVWLLVLAMRFL